MESRKRETESDLDRENPDENHFDTGVENEKWSEASPEEIESRRIVKVNSLPTNKEEVHINPFLTTTFPSAFKNTSNEPFKAGFGFQSYSNINPFAAIKSSAFPSNQLSSSFSADSSSSSTNDKNPESNSTTTTAPATTSILIPSPKSHNPFSTPSPVQNPFMSFIDNKSTTTTTASNPWATVTSTASTLGTGGFGSISGNTSTFVVASDNSFGASNASSSSISINTTESKLTANKTEEADDNDNDQNNNDENVEEEVCSGVYGKIYQLPENVVVLTGEEDEECVLQMRLKLYKLQTRSSIGDSSSSVTPTVTSITTPPTDSKAEPKSASASSAAATEKESTTEASTTTNNTTNDTSTTNTKATTSATTQPQVDWVEVGVGPVKILRKEIIVPTTTASSSGSNDAGINSADDNDNGDSSSSNVNKKSKVQQQSHRLVLRRESNRGGPGTKLLLNVALKSYVTIAKAGDKMFRLSCIGLKDENSTEYVPCTYLFKTSSNQESENLFNTIKSAINSCN